MLPPIMFNDIYNGKFSLGALKMNLIYVITYGFCGSFMLYYFLEEGLWQINYGFMNYFFPESS